MPTQITQFTKTPSRQNPSTFSQDMDTRLSEENSRITQMNTQTTENNTLALQVAADKVVVENSKAIVIQKVEEANDNIALSLQYRNEAIAAKESIDGYIVPTEATYTPSTIDTKIQNTRLENFLGFNF